jgi:DNA-binding transcriptional MerR regulator/effector-binding domain-containing protein
MNKNLLSISELAKLRNTTTETLRYYDRIGLLKPDYISPETGYRYYSIRQYEKLGTIRELRTLGMPLEQIIDYFNNRNLQKSIEILSEYQSDLEIQIQEQTKLNKILKEKLKFLKSLEHLQPLNEVFEVSFPERRMITFGEPSGTSETHAFAYTRLEWYLNEVAPILATDRVGVYADESLLEENEGLVPAIPMIIVNRTNKKMEYLKTIPAGQYLCMYYKNGTLEKYDRSFEIMKAYIKENGLTVSGYIFQIYKIDVTLTNNREETIMELQVPVV